MDNPAKHTTRVLEMNINSIEDKELSYELFKTRTILKRQIKRRGEEIYESKVFYGRHYESSGACPQSQSLRKRISDTTRYIRQSGVERSSETLLALVRRGGSFSEAKALVERGADVNYVKRPSDRTFFREEQDGTRSEALQEAVCLDRADLVDLLAPKADPVALNASLAFAFERRNIIRSRAEAMSGTLIECGADISLFEHHLPWMVMYHQEEFVALFTESDKKFRQKYLSRALRQAISMDWIEIIPSLLNIGADVDFGEAQALTDAVLSNKPEIVKMLLKAKLPPTYGALASCLLKVYRLFIAISQSERHLLYNILLEAGANGRYLRIAFDEAVGQHDWRMIDLLLKYEQRIFPDYEKGEIIDLAMSARSVELMERVLKKDRHVAIIEMIVQKRMEFLHQHWWFTKQILSLLMVRKVSWELVNVFAERLLGELSLSPCSADLKFSCSKVPQNPEES